MMRILRSPRGLLLVLLMLLFASDLSLGATAVKKVASGQTYKLGQAVSECLFHFGSS